MERKRPVRCADNEEIALYLWNKRQEMAEPNGISENLDLTLGNAYKSICNAKTPIKNPKDLSQVKGVGKWILRLMKGFFPDERTSGDAASPTKNAAQKGKKAKGPKRYLPQKNSVAYALLITLYRGIANGKDFMKKQELIDAAEASGLSRTAIGSDKVKAKPSQFSLRDWYTGWSCMTTLISKGLVVKSSNPAKYMLTQEGKEAARDCLLRSGLIDSMEHLPTAHASNSSVNEGNASDLDIVRAISVNNEATLSSASLSCQKEVNDISNTNLRSGHIDSSDSDCAELLAEDCPAALTACTSIERKTNFSRGGGPLCQSSNAMDSASCSFSIKPCTSFDLPLHKSLEVDATEQVLYALAMPPRRFGEKFGEIYDVILILDDRENFGSLARKVVDSIRSQFKVPVEIRRLPVGDGIWVARHSQSSKEYVLDFIVERKQVDDLCSSIRDNRYRDQKLRLQRCGLRKLIYLVEGDPNSIEAAESIKTACFTTEILEGFDVQRTIGFADTARRYGHLTLSITQYYSKQFSCDMSETGGICLSYNDFIKKCQDLEKMTVSDVFALQLMQVPQVTEEVALAVINQYPTLLSLARAYSLLEGNVSAQEEMLKSQIKIIGGGASRNIYKLVWGS